MGRFERLSRFGCPAGLIRLARETRTGALRDDGGAIVEMAFGMMIMLAVIFGIFQVSYIVYVQSFCAEAARDATRYASVRGPDSCTISAKLLPDCNLTVGNDGTKTGTYFGAGSTQSLTLNPLLNYIEKKGWVGLNSSNLSVTVNYYYANVSDTGGSYSTTTWTSKCTVDNDTSQLSPYSSWPCNNFGNAIKVTVAYNVPVSFFRGRHYTLPVTATSWMVIAE